MSNKAKPQSTLMTAIQWMEKRGVHTDQIAELVYELQRDYYEQLSMDECEESVRQVLKKREVQNAVLTGIQLDILTENGMLEEPLQSIIARDEGLYGCDEILALSIVNVYGSIGLTNFGYIDKLKPGIVGQLDNRKSGQVHTFLDDIVGAIAASASSRLAHDRGIDHF